MGLSIAQKSTLIARFAPVFFLNLEENSFPVKPEAFIERSALWSSRIPYDNKMLWGQGINTTRSPLIPRGGIQLTPLDPRLLDNNDGELWLETAGWARDEKVEISTDNRTCNVVTPDRPYQLNSDGPWFYAEVCDLSIIANWFESETLRKQMSLDWSEFLEVVGTISFICYYFLFPRHIEVGQLARSDGSLEPSGNYEGDWKCFCAVIKHGDDPTDIDLVEPIFAGFSRSRRGASSDFGDEFNQEYMELLSWEQVSTANDHAGVAVALGTHNLYPLNATQGEAGGIRLQWFDMGSSVSEPANKFVQDSVESHAGNASAAVTFVKVLVGLALASIPGAIAGAIAGGAEAVAIHEGLDEKPELKPGEEKPPEWPDDLEDPRDQLEDPTQALAIVPQGQAGLIPLLTGAVADATNVSFWLDDREKTIVDRAQQLFWFDQLTFSAGYQGRWGVRCNDDPFSRRAGGKIPEFRLQILKRLVVVSG